MCHSLATEWLHNLFGGFGGQDQAAIDCLFQVDYWENRFSATRLQARVLKH